MSIKKPYILNEAVLEHLESLFFDLVNDYEIYTNDATLMFNTLKALKHSLRLYSELANSIFNTYEANRAIVQASKELASVQFEGLDHLVKDLFTLSPEDEVKNLKAQLNKAIEQRDRALNGGYDYGRIDQIIYDLNNELGLSEE